MREEEIRFSTLRFEDSVTRFGRGPEGGLASVSFSSERKAEAMEV